MPESKFNMEVSNISWRKPIGGNHDVQQPLKSSFKDERKWKIKETPSFYDKIKALTHDVKDTIISPIDSAEVIR